MKKVLFVDRDGTIIVEPPTDFQVDSLEKLMFLPKVISNLKKLADEAEYELVMVTNQDGLGTDSFPENTFWPAHNKMLEILETEGISFADQLIDRTFEHENAPTRKPNIGLLTKYLEGNYDLTNSFVIGDRLTDVILAKNLGTKAILLQNADYQADGFQGELQAITRLVSTDWNEIYEKVKLPDRIAEVQRNTNETKILVQLNLDGRGWSKIETGLGFFDHMLDQLAKHSGADLIIKVEGDLHIDEHHTIEDTALALGEAYLKAIGDKRGISRYGFLLPMDEALAQVAIDFSGRNWLVWEADFKREKIGEMPTEMFYHFFKSFSDTAKCNLNIKVEGDNEHHKIEAIFKAWAKSIKMAVKRDINALDNMPSTKGVL
ncbi:MAG: bifunctional histidinol-phosphatase/imidazoleglycerol-phosphate dehydratase HisB [Bacteroidota bacterium]